MAVTAAVAAVVGTTASVVGQAKSASAQREAGRISSAQQRIEDRNTRREQARQERIRRAQILQSGEALGTTGSSTESGAISSLSTQVSANSARLEGQSTAAQAITAQNQNAANAQVVGTLGRGVQTLGSQAFSEAGGFDELFKE